MATVEFEDAEGSVSGSDDQIVIAHQNSETVRTIEIITADTVVLSIDLSQNSGKDSPAPIY